MNVLEECREDLKVVLDRLIAGKAVEPGSLEHSLLMKAFINLSFESFHSDPFVDYTPLGASLCPEELP